MRFDHWYTGDPTPIAYRLKDALEAALHEEGLAVETPRTFSGIEGFYADNIKVNKLGHRAIETWNLPMVRSWYKYGQVVPYEELSPESMSPQPLSVSSKRPTHPPSPSGAGKLPTREAIRDWFLELKNPSLREIMKMDMYDFLQWDYETFAEDYETLYLTNLDLLRLFEDIGTLDDLLENADNYRGRLQELTLDLKYEMSRSGVFGEEVSWFVERALRTVQDSLIRFANEGKAGGQREKAIRDSYYRYHSNIWHWPALYISIDRAEGPEEYVDQFITRRREDAVDTSGTSPNWLESNQEELLNLDLLPRTSDYTSVYGATPDELRAVGELTRPLRNGG